MSSKFSSLASASRVAKGASVEHPLNLSDFLPYRMDLMAIRMASAGYKLGELISQSGVEVSRRAWRVIAVIGAMGGMTNRQICGVTGFDATAVTRAVKELKSLGFVDTLNSKRDRRKVLIVLTDKGANYHDQIMPKRIETGNIINSAFDGNEYQTLIRLLNKLDKHLDSLEIESLEEWE